MTTPLRTSTKANFAGLGVLLMDLMAHAERSEEMVMNATLNDNSEWLSRQLYYMLVMLNKGLSLDRVTSAGANEGLEAWRTLVRFHEPASRTRAAGLLHALLRRPTDCCINGRSE